MRMILIWNFWRPRASSSTTTILSRYSLACQEKFGPLPGLFFNRASLAAPIIVQYRFYVKRFFLLVCKKFMRSLLAAPIIVVLRRFVKRFLHLAPG